MYEHTDEDKGYRKALEDVFDALKSRKLQGVWWLIEEDLTTFADLVGNEYNPAEGVPDEESPTR